MCDELIAMFGTATTDDMDDDVDAAIVRSTIATETLLAATTPPPPPPPPPQSKRASKPPQSKRARKQPATGNETVPPQLPPVLEVHKKTLGGHPAPDGDMFRAVYPVASQLGPVLAKLRGVVPQVQMMFAPDVEREDGTHHRGMTVVAFSAGRTLYVQVHVPRRSFIAYENCSEVPDMAVCVYTQAFFAERDTYKRADRTLTLYRFLNGEERQPLGVQLYPAAGRSQYMHRMLLPVVDEPTEPHRDIDSTCFHQYAITMRVTDFLAIVRRFHNRFKTLAIALTDRAAEFTGHGVNGKETSYDAIPYDATTLTNLTPLAGDECSAWQPPIDDPGALSSTDRAILESLDASHAEREVACHLTRLPFAPDNAQRSDITNVRFAVDMLAYALSLVHGADYVELRVGRMTKVWSEFAPMRIAFCVLDPERQRALITTHVFISPDIETS